MEKKLEVVILSLHRFVKLRGEEWGNLGKRGYGMEKAYWQLDTLDAADGLQEDGLKRRGRLMKEFWKVSKRNESYCFRKQGDNG